MKLIRTLYLSKRLFQMAGVVVFVFIVTFVLDLPVLIPKILFIAWLAVALTDLILLYRTRVGLRGSRRVPERLSNGDDNDIRIALDNFYPFKAALEIIDEVPHQFQRRDLSFNLSINSGDSKVLVYSLRPVKRGEYSFGSVNVFVESPISFFKRRFRFSEDVVVPVYPSFIQMRKYELMAISNRLTEVGIKRIRRIGQNMEFELIKEYVSGDDFRTVNWRATARKNSLMVNHYQDERSQQVYSLIDKGRVMEMPFNGLSLLDYAINASLVISNIAIKKSDKAGLITFQHKVNATVPAGKQSRQMATILEVLYNQKTAYKETDYASLFSHIRRKITQRSLLLLFTNFESLYSLQRQLPYLKRLADQHLLVVIFFENTELEEVIRSSAESVQQIYHKAIAEKLSTDKKMIVKELTRHGIQAVLTPPELLTVNTINKYLELKARGMI
ncbi:DUF58 domain-containing protein [Chryseolinea sp. T2]|uniref:DUF58 domain-containing protein n=1 Tax=Chryseolinea sp. T2 TaxID=3129255 RepID=UPI003077A833